MPRDGRDERVVDAMRKQVGGDELGAVEVRLERSPALEIGVDVDATLAPEDLEAQDVASLGGHPQALARLGTPELGGDLRLGP